MLARPFWPVVEYVINYDYIVNTLCENRDRPELQCNGSCYLSKQLAKQLEDSESNPFEKNSKNGTGQPLFIQECNALLDDTSPWDIVRPVPLGKNSNWVSQLYDFVQPKPPQA